MFDLEENEKGQSHRDIGRKEIWCVDVTMGAYLKRERPSTFTFYSTKSETAFRLCPVCNVQSAQSDLLKHSNWYFIRRCRRRRRQLVRINQYMV